MAFRSPNYLISVLSMCLLSFAGATTAMPIEGEILIDPPPDGLRRGQTVSLQYRMTNVGSTPLDYVEAVFEFYTFGPDSRIFPIETAETPPCVLFADSPFSPIPGQPHFLFSYARFEPRPILPGESRTCRFAILISSAAPDRFTIPFIMYGVTNGSLTPIFRQDVEFRLRGREAEIPVMSRSALFALVALMLLSTWWIQRRG